MMALVRSVMRGNYVVAGRTFTAAELREWLDAGVGAVTGPYMVDPNEHFIPLSAREMEILQHVTRGKSNKEIADALIISEKTVKTHVSNILSKLHLADRTQAAIYALRQRLVDF